MLGMLEVVKFVLTWCLAYIGMLEEVKSVLTWCLAKRTLRREYLQTSARQKVSSVLL